jgi:hypothetical protein
MIVPAALYLIIYDLATDIKNDDRVNGSMRRRADRAGKSWSAKLPSPPVTIDFTKAAESSSLIIAG